jgi:hypothetical protein
MNIVGCDIAATALLTRGERLRKMSFKAPVPTLLTTPTLDT